jgi:hypothetical protein
MFKHFLHLAFRAFFKDRTSGLINIVGLSLGMTGALLIGMWVNNELSYDRYHDHSERIYRLKTHIKISDTETWHWSTTPLKLANILGTQLAEVELIAQCTGGSGESTVKLKDQLVKVKQCVTIDSSWFKLFKYESQAMPMLFLSIRKVSSSIKPLHVNSSAMPTRLDKFCGWIPMNA